MNKRIAIAVAGNPNVGKSTLFNALTGLKQTTGNYPGVTVERKVGLLTLNGATAELIDLPGTYSLAARSPDEMIVADVLLGQQKGEDPVDAVLAVVDASNLERNLYLVSQLQELDIPVVVALNMIDLAERRGIRIDAAKLTANLGCPVVPVCASKRAGIEALKEALTAAVHGQGRSASERPVFSEDLRLAANELTQYFTQRRAEIGRDVPRVEAFRILVDRGGYAEQRMLARLNGDFPEILEAARARASAAKGSLPAQESRSRYAWIRSVTADSVKRPAREPVMWSDRIDAVLTHKVYGTLAFALLMAAVFQAIYSWSAPLMDLIDGAFAALSGWVSERMPEGALQSLIANGVIAGVGGVLVFLPQITVLSLFIAILEDCGYMARAAFLMDKLLSRVGLSGQSFIPLLSSFACAIPGIMATRTIPNRRDRFATMMVAPLMSCSARLPVYTVMIGAFIPGVTLAGGFIGLQGLTLFLMYCAGITIAIPVAWTLKKTLLKGAAPAFVLELPSYKWPQWRNVAHKTALQALEFVRRAGTLILAISIIVWALAYFPRSQSVKKDFEARRAALIARGGENIALAPALAALAAEEEGELLRHSALGYMGRAIEPLVKPLGWDWRIGMATIASFPAREVVVATLGAIFNLGGEVDEESETLHGALKTATWPDGRPLFNVPVALSLMVFFALCCQCGATLAMLHRETRSWRWPAFTFAYMTTLAYIAAFIVYHGALFMGWETT